MGRRLAGGLVAVLACVLQAAQALQLSPTLQGFELDCQRPAIRPSIKNFSPHPLVPALSQVNSLRGGQAAGSLRALETSILLALLLPGVLLSAAPSWSKLRAFQGSHGSSSGKLNSFLTRSIGLSELSNALYALLAYKEDRPGAALLAALLLGGVELACAKASGSAQDSTLAGGSALLLSLAGLVLAGRQDLATAIGCVIGLLSLMPSKLGPQQKESKAELEQENQGRSLSILRLLGFSGLVKPILKAGVVFELKQFAFCLAGASYLLRFGAHLAPGLKAMGQTKLTPKLVSETLIVAWLVGTRS
mmetsp:Transcript_9217/g.14557  ORF Transcript_9217/g.14557 Transcript_9217/m.14557 type:complete len:305 (-) Transcript_9217:242-1156(-)